MILEAIRVVSVGLVSFILALSITPTVIHGLKRLKFGKTIRVSAETPIFSSLHKKKEGTPTMGGVVIWITVLVVALALWGLDAALGGFFSYLNFVDRAQTYLPLAAFGIAAIIGLADDLFKVLHIGGKDRGLKMSHRIFMYIIISAVGAWWFYSPAILDWQTIRVPFFGNFDIGAWYIPIFMFIIVASAFSANETDGLDGLFGGISLFAFGALAVVAFTIGRYDLAVMSGAIMGSLLAFLWFNIFPARFFMGDTGSMALGITIGVITMLTNTVFLLPFFFIIPVIESLSVIIQVTSKKLFKQKVFLSTPIHHHFEALGWPESQITMRFWIVSVIFTGLGLVIFFADRFF